MLINSIIITYAILPWLNYKVWFFTQTGDHGASELDNCVDWSAEGNISKSGDPEVVFLNQ